MRTVAAVVLLILALAAPADADPPRVVTVVPTFQTHGSGWRVAEAIAAWNDAQDVVKFVLTHTPGPETVYLHRYSAEDGWGGYALGQDVYLNERYHPRSLWRDPQWRCITAATLAHELGHTLGLVHSDDPADLMYGGPRHGAREGCATPTASDVRPLWRG